MLKHQVHIAWRSSGLQIKRRPPVAQRTKTAYAGILDTPYDPEYGLDLVVQAERLTLDDEVERLNALAREEKE